MELGKRIISVIAVSLFVIIISANVVYATEGTNINETETNGIVETLGKENVVLEEDVVEISSETEISVSENAEINESNKIGTIIGNEIVVDEVMVEGAYEEIIEGDEEENEIVENISLFENPYIWTSENFQISYNITNNWGTGYQCEITITNIGDRNIEDWKLVLESTDTIENIWNAVVTSSEAGVYKLDNVEWNGNISVGNSVSFGYVASYEETPCIPVFYGVGGVETELGNEAYQITYQVNNLWEEGYIGYITINNTTDKDLKNWKLTFDLSDTITNLWNGVVVSNENGQYVVEYASYNSIIPAGESVTIGFEATANVLQVYPENYIVKVAVHNEIDTTFRDDVIGIAYFEPIVEDDVRIAEDGIQYVADQLNIVGEEDCTFEQIALLGEEYGFEIVGYIELTGDYQVKFVNDKTYEELLEFCELFERLDYVCETNLNMAMRVQTQKEDGFYDDDEQIFYPLSGDWTLGWDGILEVDTKWGMESINAPKAWYYNAQMEMIKVGIVELGFGPHTELKYKKMWNSGDEKELYNSSEHHGTMVAGIIASDWLDTSGIVGVSYAEELYAYAYRNNGEEQSIYESIMEEKYALALLIGNGVRVINFSVAIEPVVSYAASNGNANAKNYIEKAADIVEEFLNRLLERGYDFIIVQGAGNDNDDYFVKDISEKYGYRYINRIQDDYYTQLTSEVEIGKADAQYVNIYSCMDELQNRILVVGAYGIRENEEGTYIEMSNFSNIGTSVSVVAPGEKIYSTLAGGGYSEIAGETREAQGTSFATPYVSGTAALVYSINPELSGVQVKEIIIKASTQKLRGISSYVINDGAYTFCAPADNTEYKCLNAGEAVKIALAESGDTPILGENSGFISSHVDYETIIGENFKPAGDVQISAYRYSTYDGNVQADYQYTTISDVEGNFILCVDPGLYQLTIYKKGYIPVVIDNIEVLVGEIAVTENISLIKEVNLQSKFEITGKVINALDATPVDGANIQFRKGWDATETDTIIGTTVTNENGEYKVELKRGYYTAQITKEGYNSGLVNIVVYDNMAVQTAVLTPKLQENEMRIILTWGDSPRDLDSHMYISNGHSNYHVYYSNKIACNNGKTICRLDYDDTSSYGPETITLYMDDLGVNYKYSVYQFSAEGDISMSGARVVVYYGSNDPVTYHIPVQQEGRTWEVFAIENGKIIPINKRY